MKKYFLTIPLALFFGLIPYSVLALTISPPTLEIELEPSQEVRAIIKVFNETERDLTLINSVEAFQSQGEEGQPKFIPPEEKNQFLNWFEISAPELILKSGQIALVPFTIKIPKEVVPGGYYAAILWQEAAGKVVDSGIGISSKVGTLVLLKIKGEIIENSELLEFKVKIFKKFSLPIDFLIRLQNLGNIHLKPQGEITIKNFLNQPVKILEINSTGRAVLPQSIRKFQITWGQLQVSKFFTNLIQEFNYLIPGKYLAELNLETGIDQKQKFTAAQSFWLIPYRLIFSLIILIIIFWSLIKIRQKVKYQKIKKNEEKNFS